MSRQCNGGPGFWILYTLAPPVRLNSRKERSVTHFLTRAETLAVRKVWKQRHARNPDALAYVAPWQPNTKSKRQR